MKKFVIFLVVVTFLAMPMVAMAKMGSGKVTAKSKDIDIEMFGTLKTYPHFFSNPDFNDDDTPYDKILDENGWMDDTSIRNEFRLGWKGSGKNWDFIVILESDFILNKNNGDRGDGGTLGLGNNAGMSGASFGVEKLQFRYYFEDYGLPVGIETGWQTKWLDIKTGGLVYGDDHPYIGLYGKIGSASWEALYMTIQDTIDQIGPNLDGDALDWRAYTLKVNFPIQSENLDIVVSPFYAFSENEDHKAYVNYLGAELYGKIGMFTPRLELAYAIGSVDDAPVPAGAEDDDLDVGAFSAFASLDINFSKSLIPYIGGYYIQGDDDAFDDDVEAFNPITNISRYTPTFGMENAFIYRLVPALGSHLYANDFGLLGKTPGYGGISNSNKLENPGMIMVGGGLKGTYNKWSYKTQIMYFWFDETGALEDLGTYAGGNDIDDNVGLEFDLQLTYKFSNHFSIGNVFALFDPGDGVEDIMGEDYDETAIMDTVELKWSF
ncbi:MAG: hypothetical protein DRG59_11755 [Deltaproteobacteria bacterium]|nr:MAG: hypothetical protein DRG59_11755 [Deltaproteobacteria bacterium]